VRICNLLDDAVKFTPAGGQVAPHVRRQDSLPHVFDRFRHGSAGTDRRCGGHGLGLAIAKELAELHAGTITAHRQGEGHGATFTVHLPPGRRFATSASATAFCRDARCQCLAGAEVLLVEDEAVARASTGRLLEQYGPLARAASSAVLAREAFEDCRPDVIVADIATPGEDGYSLLAHLRRLEVSQGTARVPVLALTAFARKAERARALAAGFDEHLTKPVDPERLVGLLTQWMRAARYPPACAG
jgi:CheY-like chemotaxis protein